MLLLRHGESEWNVVFSKTGIDQDIPDPRLTSRGRRQAEAAARALEPHGIVRLITSPYKRAIETASIVADLLGLDIEVEPLVRERCAYSCDQGSPPEELSRWWPHLDFSDLDERWWGEGVESLASVVTRCNSFLELSAGHRDRERTAVVCHWGFIRAMTGRSLDNAEMVRVPHDLPVRKTERR